MLSTPTPQSLTETPAVSSPRPARVARTHVLPVAEIYSVLNAERNAGEVIVACVVGDERNPAKRHGLRAPRSRWLQLVKALAAEDPARTQSAVEPGRHPIRAADPLTRFALRS